MNLGNSSTGDGIRLSVGGPLVVPSPNPNGYVAGTLVEIATVVVTSAPFTSSGSGQAAERIDLFQPMQFTGSVNSSNLALSTVVHAMPCGTSMHSWERRARRTAWTTPRGLPTPTMTA